MTIVLTSKRGLAGGRRVHAAQGGGDGLRDATGRPRYLAGKTWCGVEKRSGILLVETDARPDCRACLRLKAAVENR